MGKRTFAIAPNAHPVVRALFRIINSGPHSDEDLGALSGYGVTTIRNWRHARRNPPISGIEDLAALYGYELVLRRKS